MSATDFSCNTPANQQTKKTRSSYGCMLSVIIIVQKDAAKLERRIAHDTINLWFVHLRVYILIRHGTIFMHSPTCDVYNNIMQHISELHPNVEHEHFKHLHFKQNAMHFSVCLGQRNSRANVLLVKCSRVHVQWPHAHTRCVYIACAHTSKYGARYTCSSVTHSHVVVTVTKQIISDWLMRMVFAASGGSPSHCVA